MTKEDKVSVFISHKNSPVDFDYSLKIYNILVKNYHIPCWMDREDLHYGPFRDQIKNNLADAEILVLIASDLAFQSDEIGAEIDIAIGTNEKKVIPVYLERECTRIDNEKLKRYDKGFTKLFGGSYQGVIVDDYKDANGVVDIDKVVKKLVDLMPRNITKLENDPDDFIFKGNNVLHRYKGEDIYVEVPYYTEEIDESAFSEYSSSAMNLSHVAIPDSVKEIGEYAFLGCQNLLQVDGMAGVVDVESNAFDDTPVFEKSNGVVGDVLLKIKDDGDYITLPEARVVANNACKWGNVKKVVIPEGTQYIGKSAFADCTRLEEVELPSTLIKIGKNAFFGCRNLKKAVIHGDIPEIENIFNQTVVIEKK